MIVLSVAVVLWFVCSFFTYKLAYFIMDYDFSPAGWERRFGEPYGGNDGAEYFAKQDKENKQLARRVAMFGPIGLATAIFMYFKFHKRER